MTSEFSPRDPDFERRVRQSFERQRIMATMGATLTRVEPGCVEIAFSRHEEFVQQHGYLHAGVLATVADSACGYAALSLMPPGSAVLSVEFKVNLLAPASGSRFLARGRVVKPGRTVTVVWGEVVSVDGDEEKLVTTMVGTMMRVEGRGIAD